MTQLTDRYRIEQTESGEYNVFCDRCSKQVAGPVSLRSAQWGSGSYKHECTDPEVRKAKLAAEYTYQELTEAAELKKSNPDS